MFKTQSAVMPPAVPLKDRNRAIIKCARNYRSWSQINISQYPIEIYITYI